jgi:hypothetical protein
VPGATSTTSPGPAAIYLILWLALPKSPVRISARRIAEERYARGEISAAELERVRNDLQAAP